MSKKSANKVSYIYLLNFYKLLFLLPKWMLEKKKGAEPEKVLWYIVGWARSEIVTMVFPLVHSAFCLSFANL
jgi:hypothetical protein